MAKCLNCGENIGCSCKRIPASDGKSCCSKCLNKYEQSLGKGKANELEEVNQPETETQGNQNSDEVLPPIINSVKLMKVGE